MWELSKRSARGRISLRRFSLVVTAMLVAIFTLTTAISPKALAADAVRNGDTVTYDNRTFDPISPSARPSGIPKDVSGYASLDESGKKAYFILTTGDTSKATTGEYVVYDFTPPSNFSNPSPPVTVAIADAPATPTSTTTSGTSGCNSQFLQGIGWILCPMVNFLASGMDHLFDILTGFLVVQPAVANADNSLFRMWGIIRNIANIAFVIAFLVVIYSQITSIGISTYGIKRIMPRLIIAAVLVNVSFWVCALAIDISNTMGYGIHTLFMNVLDSFNTSGAYQNLTWSNVATTVLSGSAVGALAAYGIYGALGAETVALLFTFIPTLVGVLLSILVALLVIAVRQALITCLVIVAPLAFVAYLLPNTEKYFTKWRELFVTLLLVYPMFSLVFGGAQLAGMAIIQNAGGSLSLIILGMAVQIAPVAITPLLLKLSGSLVGQVAALANNPRKNIMDKTKTWADARAAEEKARRLSSAAHNGRLVRLSRSINDRRKLREGQRKNYEERDEIRFAATERGKHLDRLKGENAVARKGVDNEFAGSAIGMDIERRSRTMDVAKTNIESAMMEDEAGRVLRQAQINAESRKTEVETAFYAERDGRGEQADMRRREAERGKQTVASNLEHEWHFRNETDAGAQEREMNLRVATDRAAGSKNKVDATYAQMKAGQAPRGATAGTVTLAKAAYEVARANNLDTSRATQAEGVRQIKVNEEMLKNKVRIDGKKIVDYAAGIGKTDTVLASVIAKQRKDFDEAQSAQSELMKHFKVNAPDVMNLSMGVKPVSKKDDHGNVHVFDMTDDATREAAIEMVGTVGSHNDKKKLVLSSGAKKDANGNVIPGTEKINYKSRASIQAMVIKSGFGGIAPGVNDKALNEMLNGDFYDDTDWNFHNAREIAEGRIKVSTLAAANQDSLKTLYDTKYSNEPDFVAARQRLQAEGLMDKFNAKYETLKGMTVQVLTTPTIRQNATSESIDVMLDFVRDVYAEDASGRPIKRPPKANP